ncbi:hypothetical protein SAMN05660461_3013 [Chitinophaga ginsengisegetis]|uniref:Uncharacterized protein n=1 Tax=Chitinophaga ginsengisegetis TaxID=393003 RepID=A0A1T5NYD3_9BACT|nr:hypothetical protein [Chitinophaga ginsengisegetis]MDR6567244.1 hypothetical protein [Chitinophaga ginsengisegetis]MDR6646974.1 hypothetical protein [Chitinophaga ginsengisegetis]MDR6653324.1 hypothetical protein [Chitinophaga ginsengisegetis]SKD05109.1 hypothetical protein SAMN05660461_3013 [Chitinophaga ginsengisegetis]
MSYEPLTETAIAAYREACSNWIRTLKALREDNASLINRLAAALKETTRRSFIEEAEEFQLTMLDREESLVLLRHEIGEQLDWLNKQPAGVPAPHPYAVLKNDMEGMMQEYERLKVAFLVFIAAEKV